MSDRALNRILAILLGLFLGGLTADAVDILSTATHYGNATTENYGYTVNLPPPLYCGGVELRSHKSQRVWFPVPFVNVDCF